MGAEVINPFSRKQLTHGNGIIHTLTRNARQLSDRSLDAYGATRYLDDGYDYDANADVAVIIDGSTSRARRSGEALLRAPVGGVTLDGNNTSYDPDDVLSAT